MTMQVAWQAEADSVKPPSFQMGFNEDITISFDTTAYGNSPSSPSAVLYTFDTGSDVSASLEDQPTLGGGNIVNQRLRNLASGTTYRLEELVTIGGNVMRMLLYVEVMP